eukprot:403359187
MPSQSQSSASQLNRNTTDLTANPAIDNPNLTDKTYEFHGATDDSCKYKDKPNPHLPGVDVINKDEKDDDFSGGSMSKQDTGGNENFMPFTGSKQAYNARGGNIQ